MRGAALPQYRRKTYNASKITASEKCLFNISIEANIVDPDQTAPTEQSDLDSHCLSMRLYM